MFFCKKDKESKDSWIHQHILSPGSSKSCAIDKVFLITCSKLLKGSSKIPLLDIGSLIKLHFGSTQLNNCTNSFCQFRFVIRCEKVELSEEHAKQVIESNLGIKWN